MAIFNSYVKLPEGNSHGFIRRKIRKGNQPRIHGLELQRHTKAVRNDGFWRSGDLWFESKWYPCPCVEISCFPSMYSIYIYIHIYIYMIYIYIYVYTIYSISILPPCTWGVGSNLDLFSWCGVEKIGPCPKRPITTGLPLVEPIIDETYNTLWLWLTVRHGIDGP